MTTTRIAGKPTSEAEARELQRVAMIADYMRRISHLAANVPTEPSPRRPASPFRARDPIVPSTNLSSSPSSPSTPSLPRR